MPTPFYHLSLAQALLEHSALPLQLKENLHHHQPAFFLGHIAPDVQVVSKQKRTETHFYNIPIKAGILPPWEEIIRNYPGLLAANNDYDQLVFVAGFLCHLQVDWYWTQEIFEPIFGPSAFWSTLKKRLYLHNVLRSYLDRQVLHNLSEQTGHVIALANIQERLPFVNDPDLIKWRNFLAEQLQPGAKVKTVEVFANRQGISPEKYYGLLDSDLALDQQIFNRLSRRELDIFQKNILKENIVLLQALLK